MDIWNAKIMPAIDDCVAFILLWSRNAAAGPQVLLRELDYARTRGKKTILFAEADIALPSAFPSDIERVRTSGGFGEMDLITLVESIEETYRVGGYQERL